VSTAVDTGHAPSAAHPLAAVFSRRAQRLLLVVGAVAVAVQAYGVAVTPPATGYETSVVTPYPLGHWVAFGVGVAAVVLVALGSAMRATGYWRYAFALLVASYGLFLSLPVARGYALYGRGSSDPLFHFAVVREVLATGDPPGVFYPLVHVFAAEFARLGVPLHAIQHLLAFALTLLFLAGTTVLVRTLLDDPRGYPLGLAAAAPLLLGEFHVQLHPAVLSVALLPVVAAAIERLRRTDSRPHLLVAAALVFALVFLHPVTTLMATALVVTTALASRAYPYVTGVGTRRLRATVALALVPAAFVWYLGFDRTQSVLVRVLGASAAAPVAQQATLATSASLSTEELLVRFGQLYGAVFVYFLLAGLACLLVVATLRRASYPEFYLVVQYAVGGGLAAAFLVVYLIASDPVRISRYLICFSAVVLAVVAGSRLLPDRPAALVVDRDPEPVGRSRTGAGNGDGPGRSGRRSDRTADGALGARTDGGSDAGKLRPNRSRPVTSGGRVALALVLASAIVLAAVVGAFAVYQPNKHLTHAEVEGAEFALVYHDGETPVRSFGLTLKTQWFVLGERAEEYPRPVYDNEPDTLLAPRLGYGTNGTAAASFGRSYLVTQAYDTTWHTADYYTPAQQAERFYYGEADVARLTADRTVDRVYTNGGFDLWAVR